MRSNTLMTTSVRVTTRSNSLTKTVCPNTPKHSFDKMMKHDGLNLRTYSQQQWLSSLSVREGIRGLSCPVVFSIRRNFSRDFLSGTFRPFVCV